jgi:hypothetical protein
MKKKVENWRNKNKNKNKKYLISTFSHINYYEEALV